MNFHHAPNTPALDDAYAKVTTGAQSGAYGANDLKTPSDAKAQAGNYKMGRASVQGFRIAIEQPEGSIRTGTGPDGKEWSSRMAAHYGYFENTRGADGDGIDCFVGPYPESEQVFVINQRNPGGGFDEHKVMVGFSGERHARGAYMDSYERGWRGLQSLVPISLDQLRWWIKHGKKNIALTAELLPQQGTNPMNPKITWNEAQPDSISLDQVLYELRRMDGADGLLLDSVTMAEIMEDTDGVIALDALVVENAQLARLAERLRAIMDRSGGEVKAPAVQVSDPFRARGVTNIATVFELSDGQTVSVFFHNPDTAPNKLAPGDEMISWKWLLNKKDITIVVAPEKGQDLNPRLVAQRIMRLAEKNSPAFQKANAKRAERLGNIQAIRDRIAEKEATLTELVAQVEAAQLVKSQKTMQQEDANAATREEVKKWLEGSGYAVKDAAMSQYTKTVGDRLMFVTAAKLMLSAMLLDSSKLGSDALNPITPSFNYALIPTSEGATQPAMGYAAGFEVIKGFVEGREREAVTVLPASDPAPENDFTEALAYLTEKMGAPSGDDIKLYQASGDFGFVQVKFFEKLGSFALDYSKSRTGAYGLGSEARTADTTAEVKAFVDRLMPSAGSDDEPSPIALVDAAYQFANATDAFKVRVAGSIEETDYSEFASAKAMDMKAKSLGAEIHWGMGAALDGVSVAELGHAPAYTDGTGKWHSYTMEAMKRKDDAALRYIVKDATEAAEAGEKMDNPKAAQYRDEAHYASMEMQRRRKGGKQIMDSVEGWDGITLDAANLEIIVHRDGKKVGSISAEELRKYGQVPKTMFIDDAIKQVNEWNKKRGDNTVFSHEFTKTLDDASDFAGSSIVGKIMQGGKQKGRVVVGGDGKSMVFTGRSNDKRVASTETGITAAWGEDERMIEWLLAPAAEPEPKLSKKEAAALAAKQEREAAKASATAIAEQIDAIAKAGLKLPEGISYKFDIAREVSWKNGGPGDSISFYLQDEKAAEDENKFAAEARIFLDEPRVILFANHGAQFAGQSRTKLIEDDFLKAGDYEDLANQIVQALNGAIEKHLEMSKAAEPIAEPTVTPEPAVTPDPAPADPKTEDRAFFMSVIDGSNPDILEPELADKLAQAYERHAGDAEITSLFMQAGNAYTQAMLAATEGV